MSVMDLFRDDGPLVVDRSTLQNYAECPMRGRLIDMGRGRETSRAAEGGQEVHDAFGRTIALYVQSEGNMVPSELLAAVESEVFSARPDLQPDTIEATRRALRPWAYYVASCNPANILHYDGGQGDWSGQLALDVEGTDTQVTSEVDLAHVGASREIIEEVDYKSGWKKYTEEMTREAFQFQLHALLLLGNYPQVEEVRVRVWNTRHGFMTRRIAFTRSDLPAIEARVRSAIAAWKGNRTLDPGSVDAWPVFEKCLLCDVAGCCVAADREVHDFEMDPHGAIDTMAALNGRLEALKKLARGYVKKHGEIVTERGNAFGTGKPRKGRAPTANLYGVTVEASEAGDGEEGSEE